VEALDYSDITKIVRDGDTYVRNDNKPTDALDKTKLKTSMSYRYAAIRLFLVCFLFSFLLFLTSFCTSLLLFLSLSLSFVVDCYLNLDSNS
jgi:hypothetical protein